MACPEECMIKDHIRYGAPDTCAINNEARSS